MGAGASHAINASQSIAWRRITVKRGRGTGRRRKVRMCSQASDLSLHQRMDEGDGVIEGERGGSGEHQRDEGAGEADGRRCGLARLGDLVAVELKQHEVLL